MLFIQITFNFICLIIVKKNEKKIKFKTTIVKIFKKKINHFVQKISKICKCVQQKKCKQTVKT